MFPSGKLGVGPPNPHLLSFLCVWIGETHQANVSIKSKKKQSAATKATRIPDSPRNSISIFLLSFYLSVSFSVSLLRFYVGFGSVVKSKVLYIGIYRRRHSAVECVAFDYENDK